MDVSSGQTIRTLPHSAMSAQVQSVINGTGTVSMPTGGIVSNYLPSASISNSQVGFQQMQYDPEVAFKAKLDEYISHLKGYREMYLHQLIGLTDKASKLGQHDLPTVKALIDKEIEELVEKTENFATTMSALLKFKDTLNGVGNFEKQSKKK